MKRNDLIKLNFVTGFSDNLPGAEIRITYSGYYEYRWSGYVNGQHAYKIVDGRIMKIDVRLIEDAVLTLMGSEFLRETNCAVDDIPRIFIWYMGINGSEEYINFGLIDLMTSNERHNIVIGTWNIVMSCLKKYINAAQQVDSAEASTIAVLPFEPSGSPR